jgi:hypothetical protein
MSGLAEFGKQAAQEFLTIGSAFARQELIDAPTTTSPNTPDTAATPAGQHAPVFATDPRNEESPNLDLFGLKVNKVAAGLVGVALVAALVLKLARG